MLTVTLSRWVVIHARMTAPLNSQLAACQASDAALITIATIAGMLVSDTTPFFSKRVTLKNLMGPAGRSRVDENGGAHVARRRRYRLALRDRA